VEELDLMGGRYRLLDVIGAGGMGRVWLAEDELLRRRVAIKEITMPTDVTASEMLDMQLATMHEARAAARLDHPSVVHVYDVIWRPGRSWIVMEYVESMSLHQAGTLSHSEAARIGLGILEALRVAHAAGVLHRDVKPHNVLLATDGRVVLSDFGLASVEGLDSSPDPSVATPHFVAPERVRGETSGPAADLWSLGATLYAATEGRAPFARESTIGSLAAVLNDPPDPPKHPGPLTPIIDALLEKDPALRLTAARAEPMLRRAATRAIGIVPVRPKLPKRRTSRSTRIAMTAAAVLLFATTGSALALDAKLAPEAAGPGAPTAAPAQTTPICDDRTSGGSVVTTDNTGHQYALPAGFLWHRDSTGFVVAVPQGWTRESDGQVACFRDPVGSRAFQVEAGSVGADRPIEYWRTAEQAALADGRLPGYRRITLASIDVDRGGAEWEYTWQPSPDVRLHERRMLLRAGPDRAYVVAWMTRDQDWSTNEPLLTLIVASLS
jgi:hypothetical protein